MQRTAFQLGASTEAPSTTQRFLTAALNRARDPNSAVDPAALLRELPAAQRVAVVQNAMFSAVQNIADPAQHAEWLKLLPVAAGALNSVSETPVMMVPVPAPYPVARWQRIAIGVAGVALGVGAGIWIGRVTR